MKRAALALLGSCLWATAAVGESVRVVARDTVRVPHPSAQSVFALDTSIADATLQDGEVVVRARRAGETLVTVVLPDGVDTLSVRVEPAPRSVPESDSGAQRGGSIEVRYDSAMRRSTASYAGEHREADRTMRWRVDALHDGARGGRPASNALPFASVEMRTPEREVVLLDQMVQGGALGIDHAVLRGIHWREGMWDIHAGKASLTPFEDLVVPSSGDRAASVALRLPASAFTVVPGVLWLPDAPGHARGVASLGVAGQGYNGALQYAADVGWGGRFGAAVDVRWTSPQRQAWLTGALRPAGFASLRGTRPPGNTLEAGWTERFGRRTSASFYASANRLDVAGRPETRFARAEASHELADHWRATASLGASDFRSNSSPASRRATLSTGLSYESGGLGLSAQYRYQQASRGTPGHGGRLTLRASGSGWRTSLFVDAQQQAYTLDLLLDEHPELARAVAQLGITASDPEDMLRQFRDHAALFDSQGVSLGGLRINPRRMQAGLEASWSGGQRNAPEFGVRLLADEVTGARGTQRSYVGTLYASWHVSPQTEIGLGYSRWSLRHEGLVADDRGAVQLWARTDLSKVAALVEGNRAITGRVLQAEGAAPMAGIPVVLDGVRTTRTDADGRYSFEQPGPGAHRVEAQLPPVAGAYFASPSKVSAKPGEQAAFSIALLGARLDGRVASDAGAPLAGITVRLDGPAAASTVTDGSGRYRFAVPAGTARVSIAAESVTAGYELGELAPREVTLAVGRPQVADFSLRAQRSIQGIVKGAVAATVQAVGSAASRVVKTDAAGRFTLRGLAAGKTTLLVRAGGREARHEVELPAEPAVVKVELPPRT